MVYSAAWSPAEVPPAEQERTEQVFVDIQGVSDVYNPTTDKQEATHS